MTVDPIEAQRFLSGIDYPARKEDLLKTARDEGAGDDVRSTLERLPDQEYGSPTDVSQAIGVIYRGGDEG